MIDLACDLLGCFMHNGVYKTITVLITPVKDTITLVANLKLDFCSPRGDHNPHHAHDEARGEPGPHRGKSLSLALALPLLGHAHDQVSYLPSVFYFLSFFPSKSFYVL